MNREQVTEFLGQVPLLQRLPGSSIRRIADAVHVKRYEPGDYVAREGEPVDGLYIIFDGQAEVSAPANSEETNRPDYLLNKYDYFGYGTNSSDHQVNVVALSKVDIFRGFTLPEAPTFRQVFGGQFIGQAGISVIKYYVAKHLRALAAASKTVDCLKMVHSLHAIFLVAGDNNTYASDLLYSGVSLNPHREKGLKTYSLSLDHSMWFHKPVKADDWLLYVIESPSAHGGRGFVTGRMFNRQGELIMSLTQEALIRREKTRANRRPKL
nr:unnamed protein product [Digitaria exilis]